MDNQKLNVEEILDNEVVTTQKIENVQYQKSDDGNVISGNQHNNKFDERNPVLNAVFNTEELKDKLEEYVNQSYTKFVNYIEKYNMLSMQYCLEMDLVATDKASELYYDHYNLLGEKRNRKSLLIERKDAIKDPTVLLEIFDRLNPSEYPFSFKKIKNILVKKIKTAIITQRQNMEVEE